MREKLEELAEACEKASGPDRELDAAIALALGLAGDNMLADRHALGWCVGGTGQPHLAAAYTASLDAAMTLAGEGFGSIVAGLTLRGVPGLVAVVVKPSRAERMAATPALALCAAALRAQAGAAQ